MNSCLCIIASQRAGTTSLAEALGATPGFMNFGEVFHSDTSLWPGAFFKFTDVRGISASDMATGEQAQSVATGYLDHLDQLAGGRRPILDVKFNSWHALRSAWGYPHQRPLFMEVLRKRATFFVLIRRRNVAEQVISEQIARGLNKWHALTADDVHLEIKLDPKRAASQARLILKAETLFLEHLAMSKYAVIDYEDLYTEGWIHPELLRQLRQGFQVDLPESLAALTAKNAVDKRQVTANYEETMQAIKAAIADLSRPEPPRRIA